LFLLKLPSDFLPPTSNAVSPVLILGGALRPVSPFSLLAPLQSFISRVATSSLFLCLHLAPVVTSQSIFRTSLDGAARDVVQFTQTIQFSLKMYCLYQDSSLMIMMTMIQSHYLERKYMFQVRVFVSRSLTQDFKRIWRIIE
jgi:hypothetical protein